jgi:ferrous iron transport protein A
MRVVSVEGGHGLVQRLAGLGLTVGAEVRSIIAHDRGPMLVVVRGTRLALGRGIAARVIVEAADV